MDRKSTTYTVDQLAAMTAMGCNRDEVARKMTERFKGIKPLVTREEVDEALAEQRRVWEQKNQQQ